MRGSIYKRGKTWTVMYDERDVDGERKQRSKGGFPTRVAAQEYLTGQLAALSDGTYTTPSRLTVTEFLDTEWLPDVEDSLRPLSFAKYQQAVRLYITPRIGAVPLQALRAAHLTRMQRELAERGLSVSTRRLTHAVIRKALEAALVAGYVSQNVAARAKRPGTGESRAISWTEGEIRRFLAHVDGDRLYPLWRLAAVTGMRRGELAGLTWRYLDLDGARLYVEQQLVPTKGGATFGPPKSKRSRRRVSLDTDTVAVLRAHRETQLLERDFAGDAYVDRDMVFCDQLGAAIHPPRLTNAFAKHRKAAGIPVGSLHVLRHTAITLALTNGVPVHVVAARAGDRPEQILGTYAHLLPSSDEQAAEIVAAAVR